MSAHEPSPAQILSGEAVVIDVQPVSYFLRALGALIDMLVSIGLLVLLVFALSWWDQFSGGSVSSGVWQIMVISIIVFCFVVVPCTVETLLRGRSLGKLAVGGRIVRIDGGASGFRHAFIRATVGVLEIYMTLGAIALLTGAFSARSQRLGDLIAGTYSQQVRVSAPPPPVAVLPRGLEGWATVADVARLPDRLARRIAQFLQSADQLLPASRDRIARELLAEASDFVSPMPAAPPEQVLVAMTLVRRERERRALLIGDERAEKLLARQG